MLFGVTKLRAPDAERVGDHFGQGAGADLAAAERGIVEAAVTR